MGNQGSRSRKRRNVCVDTQTAHTDEIPMFLLKWGGLGMIEANWTFHEQEVD